MLDREQLDKWVVLDSIGTGLRITPNGFEKPQQYAMPETRRAYTDYSDNIEPGDFGVIVPGRSQDYAFRRLGNSKEKGSTLFEYQEWHQLYGRDNVTFAKVCGHPKTYVIDY